MNMKIYRVSIGSHKEGHNNYSYYAKESDALDYLEQSVTDGFDNSRIEDIEVGRSKAALIEALNRYGGHADNG